MIYSAIRLISVIFMAFLHAFGVISFPVLDNNEELIDIQELVLTEQTVITVSISVPVSDILENVENQFIEIQHYIKENDAEENGYPFVIFYPAKNEVISDIEVCVPVNKPLKDSINFICRTLPAQKVIAAKHIGPPESIGMVYEQVKNYIYDYGLKSNGQFWEIYINTNNKEGNLESKEILIYVPID